MFDASGIKLENTVIIISYFRLFFVFFVFLSLSRSPRIKTSTATEESNRVQDRHYYISRLSVSVLSLLCIPLSLTPSSNVSTGWKGEGTQRCDFQRQSLTKTYASGLDGISENVFSDAIKLFKYLKLSSNDQVGRLNTSFAFSLSPSSFLSVFLPC